VPPLTIAQVTPYPWEDGHEVNAHVAALSAELRARGHRVVVVAPSHSPALVRQSRKLIRAGETDDVLAIGELLPTLSPRRAIPSLPVDLSRTVEELLERVDFDVVHVHEPWAPSASSAALRHSRALNVATFHSPTERVLSTQVARRFVETFFGRIDARLASFQATATALNRFFPGDYEVVLPGAEAGERAAEDGPVHVVFEAVEERAALRIFLRALRRLPKELDWRATVHAPGGHVPVSATRGVLRERLTVTEDDVPPGDVVVAASSGIAPAPAVVLRALAAGAVPVVSRLPVYEELVADGEAGLVFEPSDVDVLAAQLARVIEDAELRGRLRAGERHDLSWARVAGDVEAVYDRLVGRRHNGRGNAALAKRLAARKEIDVDLHMHTDHSYDCATPVEALLAAARDRGLGAIAVTDHNEISGALEAYRKAADFGVKVIVAEEVKTAEQGEVIGLFLEKKIPKGLTLQETIAEIKRQGGLVYVPHPFDRLHSIPDYEHLLDVLDDIDAIEIFNPRVALPAFNEEAVRFASKYGIVGGAGSDSHVAQGLGSVRIRMRDFDGPEEFLESLREADIIGRPSALYYAGVQALKFLQTKAGTPAGRRAARERRVRKATRNL
jgi:glycosyltransferase involved in cell wall biosynthesis